MLALHTCVEDDLTKSTEEGQVVARFFSCLPDLAKYRKIVWRSNKGCGRRERGREREREGGREGERKKYTKVIF